MINKISVINIQYLLYQLLFDIIVPLNKLLFKQNMVLLKFLITAKLSGNQIGQVSSFKLTTKKSIITKEIILKHSNDFDRTINDK